jgi:hypothetical protein
MLESDVSKAVVKYLNTLPKCWFFKVHGGAFQMRGIPDYLGCYNGRFFAIEAKRPKVGKVSNIQRLVLDRITKAGGIAIIADSVEQVKLLLK